MDIIVVDDMRSVCLLIVDLLKTWGYTPRFFTDPSNGLEEIRKLRDPAVIILDWEMPGLSGIDICRLLKDSPTSAPVYTIVLTAKSSKADLSEALEAGANDFIGKPFDENELKARLNAGVRILNLEQAQILRIAELNSSLRIIEDDIAAGRLVQERLLPEPEKTINGARFQYAFMPSLFLSGDFLDYFPVDETAVGFYYADVAGHGASSAFLTILLKSFISRLLSEYRLGTNRIIESPAAVLDHLNGQFLSLELRKHLTIFYGVLNPAEGSFSYASGGQYPLPVISTGGGASFVPAKGLPVGILPNAVYRESRVDLSGRFTIHCFSDGIFELLPGSDLDGKNRAILDLVRDNDWDRDQWLDHFLGYCSINGAGRAELLPDDITMLKIEGGLTQDG